MIYDLPIVCDLKLITSINLYTTRKCRRPLQICQSKQYRFLSAIFMPIQNTAKMDSNFEKIDNLTKIAQRFTIYSIFNRTICILERQFGRGGVN